MTKPGLYNPIPKTLSELLLILVNILPIIGVWFWGWKLLDIFVLYWAESLIIGFYWFVKLLTVFILDKSRSQWLSQFIFTFVFFSFHFGGFMFGHIVILMQVILFDYKGVGYIELFETLFKTLYTLIVPLTLLFISHGISFIQNFIIKKEYLNWFTGGGTINSVPPYGRIVVMHITVFLVASLFRAGKFISPLSSALIILTKIVTDLRAHRIEHRKV